MRTIVTLRCRIPKYILKNKQDLMPNLRNDRSQTHMMRGIQDFSYDVREMGHLLPREISAGHANARSLCFLRVYIHTYIFFCFCESLVD